MQSDNELRIEKLNDDIAFAEYKCDRADAETLRIVMQAVIERVEMMIKANDYRNARRLLDSIRYGFRRS